MCGAATCKSDKVEPRDTVMSNINVDTGGGVLRVPLRASTPIILVTWHIMSCHITTHDHPLFNNNSNIHIISQLMTTHYSTTTQIFISYHNSWPPIIQQQPKYSHHLTQLYCVIIVHRTVVPYIHIFVPLSIHPSIHDHQQSQPHIQSHLRRQDTRNSLNLVLVTRVTGGNPRKIYRFTQVTTDCTTLGEDML